MFQNLKIRVQRKVMTKSKIAAKYVKYCFYSVYHEYHTDSNNVTIVRQSSER